MFPRRRTHQYAGLSHFFSLPSAKRNYLCFTIHPPSRGKLFLTFYICCKAELGQKCVRHQRVVKQPLHGDSRDFSAFRATTGNAEVELCTPPLLNPTVRSKKDSWWNRFRFTWAETAGGIKNINITINKDIKTIESFYSKNFFFF